MTLPLLIIGFMLVVVLAVWLNAVDPDIDRDGRSPRPTQDSWVVLVEHQMNTAWVQFDGTCLDMLTLETQLKAEGIDVAFDPFRPGESSGYTRTLAQPVRLLVKLRDVDRARDIAANLECESDGFDHDEGAHRTSVSSRLPEH